MRIGIIIGSLGIGGAERVAANLANWFVSKGHSVSFFHTKELPKNEYIIDNEIVRYSCCSKNNIQIINRLRRAIIADRPDIVLIMGRPICVHGIPALAGLGIPKVVSERSSPKNARIKKRTRILSNFLMRYADAYVFQTNGAKEYFNSRIQERGHVIPNPIVKTNIPVPYEGIRSKRFVAIGRLIKEKNYPLLIESFIEFHKSHNEYKLEIYGDGPERDKLQGIINDNNSENYIKLLGTRPDVLNCIRDAYCYVLSSDLEGMPNALIEAMALGLPCISTDCPSGGPSELIIDEENGILVGVNNKESMKKAFNRLVDYPEFSKEIGIKAQEISNQLDIETIGEKWVRLFSIVLNSNESRNAVNNED